MSIMPKLMVLLTIAALPAAESAPAKPAPAVKPVVAQDTSALGQLSAEEKWVFEPQPNRTDPLYDHEQYLLALMHGIKNPDIDKGPAVTVGPTGPGNPTDMVDLAQRIVQRVEALMTMRKWEDGMNECEKGLKMLQRYADNAQVAPLIDNIKRLRGQIEDAKLYEEAQSRFDALGLKVEGILWSPAGSLAVIAGEPRARALNDRVKDCVIINIDTNRVDFLFYYLRRRYEFQRYVGEDVTPGPKVPR